MFVWSASHSRNKGAPLCCHPAGMLALDGRCKSLDAAADGYVRAENCTAFLITSSSAEDGSSATAAVVVCGSSVNQDGRSSSLTAPNGPAQQAAIRAALRAAALQASSVGSLEMHGTGTALGDPIEVGAAVAVLQVGGARAEGRLVRVGGSWCPQQRSDALSLCTQTVSRLQPLAFTAAKSRLGHAETGAGVLGMLHAWWQLSQSAAPAVTHLRTINAYVEGSLQRSQGAVFLPRQLAAGLSASELCTGTSSFAFQVGG